MNESLISRIQDLFDEEAAHIPATTGNAGQKIEKRNRSRKRYVQSSVCCSCGLFACLNSASACGVKHSKIVKYYQAAIRKLNRKGRLEQLLLEGLFSLGLPIALLRKELGLKCWQPYKRLAARAETPLIMVEQFKTFLEKRNGHRAIIFGMRGLSFDHWSTIVRVTRQNLILKDSDCLHAIPIHKLSAEYVGKNSSRVYINQAEVWFIES